MPWTSAACPQVKSNAPPCDGRVGSLGGVLTFQHQVVYPHGVVVPDGKVVQQRRALARQHDLPRISQPCARVIGQKERLVDAGLQQALDLGKRLQLSGRKIPRQGRAVEVLTFSGRQACDLHRDFSFL